LFSSANLLGRNRNCLRTIEPQRKLASWTTICGASQLRSRRAQRPSITNTEEASHFLLNHWPVQGGKMHLEARRVCLAVLAGERPADDTRSAFIKAAQDTAIFVKA
jgi:hypothetical protein